MKATFYLTAWSKDSPQGGIYTYDIIEGRLEEAGFLPLLTAGYLCFSSDGRHLYATGSRNGEEGVAACAVNSDGTLTYLNFMPSQDKSFCHNCAAPGGKFLYAANYSSGNVAEFTLASDGRIAGRNKVIAHTGSGPVATRQESAHPHFVGITPDNAFLSVADLGIDKIVCYPFDPETGIDDRHPVESPMPSGCGPRHIHFAKDDIAYLLTELGNTVLSMKYSKGHFSVLEEISLLPEKCVCDSKASALRMSADGRFLVATNRGFDSLVVIEVDGKGGMKKIQTTLSGGRSPRDVNFLPDGRSFAAANEFSDDIYFFDFDPETGQLIPNGLKLAHLRPLCIAWR
ncbi:MAG: lactonase family protein [Lentisphaeria bacterium]|nr:lactonase family protein [Lentisphaeria bacterium]